MCKNLLRLLVLALVAAMPATALAGPDWIGNTDDWDDIATNWTEDPDPGPPFWKTSKASFDPDDVAWLGGTEMPLIDATVDTEWGYARVRNGAVITQTGGEHTWMNGTGTSNWGLNIFTGASLDMTGGKHTADRVSIGGDGLNVGLDPPDPAGVGTINVWGTGNFRIRENPFVADLPDLYISDGSLIDIRDDGVFEVPAIMSLIVQDYIDNDKIVAGAADGSLVVETIGDIIYISATAPGLAGDFDNDGDVDGNDVLVWQQGFGTVYEANDLAHWQANFGAGAGAAAAIPEPASALLALLGFGLLAVVVRRENRGI